MERIRKHLWISGRVQGVGFRYSTQQMAHQIGSLAGWVRNLRDGRVEVLAEGPPDKVGALVHWCHHGPSAAHVINVEVADEPCRDDGHGFDIA